MRAFVSVDLEDGPAAVPVGVRAPRHLTLVFLGEIADDRAPALVDRLREALRGVAPFAIEIVGTGAFPDPERPRIVFARVEDGAATLAALSDRVRAALAAGRFPFDPKPFVPHLTLLRVRGPRDLSRARALLAPTGRPPPERHAVRAVLLKASELHPGGPVHRVVARFPLGED